jgi:hypothetical protein
LDIVKSWNGKEDLLQKIPTQHVTKGNYVKTIIFKIKKMKLNNLLPANDFLIYNINKISHFLCREGYFLLPFNE